MSEQDCNFEKLCELIDRHKFVSFNDFLFYLKSVKDKDVVEFAKKNQGWWRYLWVLYVMSECDILHRKF